MGGTVVADVVSFVADHLQVQRVALARAGVNAQAVQDAHGRLAQALRGLGEHDYAGALAVLDSYHRLAGLAGRAWVLSAQEPGWWLEGERNQAGEPYAPIPAQRQWLQDQGRRVGWVDADGDCCFSATVATVGPGTIAAAMATISQLVGMAAPDLGGQPVAGRDLRLFLADVLDHALVTGDQTLRGRLGIDHTIEVLFEAGTMDLQKLVAGLRNVGDYSRRAGGEAFPFLLHDLLRMAGIGLGWIPDVGYVGVMPTAQPEPHVIVYINEHFLPSWSAQSSGPQPPPARAPVTVPAHLDQPASWRLNQDGSYAVPSGAPPPTQLPVGLRTGQVPAGAAGLQAPVGQLVRSVQPSISDAEVDRQLTRVAGETDLDVLARVADVFGLRIQLVHTTAAGVSAGQPVGPAAAPIRFLHHDQTSGAGRYVPLWTDPLPGLGRAYYPAGRRDTPILQLSAGGPDQPTRRVELAHGSWYYQGNPTADVRRLVEGFAPQPDRLPVFIGGAGTTITAQLLTDLRRELDRIPDASRTNISLIILNDHTPQLHNDLRQALNLDDPEHAYVADARGVGTDPTHSRRALDVVWATAAPAYTAADLQAMFDEGRIQIFPGADGHGVNVWFPKDEDELTNTQMADAVRKAVVPAGFAANVFAHGSGGTAVLFDRPLYAAAVAQWLHRRGIHGSIFLPGCELLTPNLTNGFAVHWQRLTGHHTRATPTSGWIDPDTGTTMATPADNHGNPTFTTTREPAGTYYDLPATGQPAKPAPHTPVNPAANWRELSRRLMANGRKPVAAGQASAKGKRARAPAGAPRVVSTENVGRHTSNQAAPTSAAGQARARQGSGKTPAPPGPATLGSDAARHVGRLQRAGLAEPARKYLNESDPGKRRALVFEMFTPSQPDLLRSLVDLTQDTAKLGSERADIAIIRAVAEALAGEGPPGRIGENGGATKFDAALADVRDLTRYLSPKARLGWVMRLDAAAPDYNQLLEEVSRAVVDC